MTSNPSLLASALGFCGVAANLVWPLMKTRTLLLRGQVVACALMLAHFLLLGANTGAAIMGVAGLQATLAIPLGTAPGFRRIYLASLALTPLVCIATWQGPPSVFSSLALALAIVCVANLQLDPLRQRALLIAAIFAWVGHNLMVHSVPGLVSNGLAFGVSAFMLLKLRRSASRAGAA